MALLTKDQILAANDITTEEVEVPEWGGTVRVQGMTGEGRDFYETQIYDAKAGKSTVKNLRAKFVAASVVDESGDLLFTDDDVKALGRKSAAALNRVFGVASRLSALTEADVQELAKNSAAAPSGDSTSG